MRPVPLLARAFFVDERVVTTLQVPGVEVDALLDRVPDDLRERGSSSAAGQASGRVGTTSRPRSWSVSGPVFTVDVEVRPRSGERSGSEVVVRSRPRPLVAALLVAVLGAAVAVAVVALLCAVTEQDVGPLWDARYLLVAAAVAAAVRAGGDARARRLAARLARS